MQKTIKCLKTVPSASSGPAALDASPEFAEVPKTEVFFIILFTTTFTFCFINYWILHNLLQFFKKYYYFVCIGLQMHS